jgi:DHA2 family multidrug resistance protein-like MFS transporter
VRIVQLGFVLNIIGSLLVGLAPAGGLASASLIVGRICQGLSAACIMPASLALVKAYWTGVGRQRAISLWSMGSWGGSGFAALFGGLVAANLGWRWIFLGCVAVSVAGMLMVRGTPESKVQTPGRYRVDVKGIATFMVAMIALQVLLTQGTTLGWLSPLRSASSRSRSSSAFCSSASSRETRTPSSTFGSSATGPTPARPSPTCCSTPSRASSSSRCRWCSSAEA